MRIATIDARGLSIFNDPVKALHLSGSLTTLDNGTSYLTGTGGISILTQSNGSLLVSGTTTNASSQGTSGVGILPTRTNRSNDQLWYKCNNSSR